MAEYDFDLFVIGAGSGGVRAARLAAMSGAKVAVAEEYRVGGTCVIRGCVPKKFMVYASEVKAQLKTAKGYGWTIGEASFDWKASCTTRTSRSPGCRASTSPTCRRPAPTCCTAGPRSSTRTPSRCCPRQGSKDAGRYTARKILIATGGRPWKPDFPGAELGITSDEAFHLPTLPKRVMVVGGGYIAVEFASIFNGLGVETTLLYRGPTSCAASTTTCACTWPTSWRSAGSRWCWAARTSAIEKTETGLLSTLQQRADLRDRRW
jgi:glutathione reductase (NADPH)